MEWIKVFSAVEEAAQHIPEQKPQLVIIGETRICIVRRRDQYYAVQDACPHKGVSLSKGYLNFLGEIVCPLHNYCFDLRNGREAGGKSRDVKVYPVKVDESGFYIGI